MPYYMYILYSAAIDKYYVGSCEDINIRLKQHNSSKTRSTSHGIPWQIMKQEIFDTRDEAVKRELLLKR